MGRTAKAYALYRQLTREAPDRTEAWIGMLNAMHAGKHDAEALEAAQSMPAELRFALRKNTGYLQAMASIYSANEDDAHAMECLKRVTAHYHAQGIAVPFAVNLQYGWLRLNAGDEAGLSGTLDALGKATDLPPAHKKQIEDLWVAWSIRRAEATMQAGNGDQAFQLLQAAAEVYPENADLRHEMGTLYIRRGQPQNAYLLYERFQWDGASEADFAGGVAAAAASNHWKQAEMWLRMALSQYPGSRQLLTEAAQVEQDHGDLKKAQTYWASLRALDDPNSEPGTIAASTSTRYASANPANQLASMLMAGHSSHAAARRGPLDEDEADSDRNEDLLSTSNPEPARHDDDAIVSLRLDSDARPKHSGDSAQLVISPDGAHVIRHTPTVNEMAVQMESEAHGTPAVHDSAAMLRARLSRTPQDGTSGDENDVLSLPAPGSSTNESGYSSSRTSDISESLESAPRLNAYSRVSASPLVSANATLLSNPDDGLAVLQAQMSAWMGGGAAAISRSGSAGFDQLTRIESAVEASRVVGDSLRMTAIVRPVILQAGQASSTALYAWGTGGTAPSGSQYASGVGGEVQIASAHVQASLGYTPSSFAVHNTVGSFAFMPTRSLSFHFSRTPVTDTLLSYARLTDTKTGEAWGGVVSTGGGIQVNHGDGHTGFYALLDYASLTDRNVTSNTKVSGSMGGYWNGYRNDNGALSVGLNMTGMHFDKDLQYFTFGQGGYFSPDIYMLINMPVTWTSKPMQNFNYVVSGSVGTQSYQQGTIVSGSLLTAQYSNPSASANYSPDARGSYRITPNWYLEAFLSANNTYDYQQRTAGFSLKYMTRPHPPSDSALPTGLFDVNAIKPLLIP